MKIVGLTGGIASGKSTVANLLSRWGVPIVDADRLGREVLEPGAPAWAQVAARWPQVVRPDRTLDRARLGALVFADPAELRALTDLVLPRIVTAFQERARTFEEQGQRCCVLEAATLLEEGLDRLVDGVLLVAASPPVQIRRLAARNGYDEAASLQRLSAQLPLEAKRARARWVLENDGTEEELEEKLRGVWRQVMEDLALG